MIMSRLHSFRSIVASAMSAEKLFVIDSTPTIYLYSHQGDYLKHANLKGFQSYPYRYGSSVAVSNDGKFGLICDVSNDRVLLVSMNPVKLLSSITVTKKPDIALFNELGSHFVIGSNSGRLNLYETLSCEKKYELQLPDEIVSVAFSKEGSKLAISTMDKKVHIFYMNTQKIGYIFLIDDIVEALTFSDDNNKIIAFSRSGSTHILNIMQKQQFLGESSMEWPTHIASGFNRHVILLGSRSNQLCIYSNSDGTKLGSIYLEYWGITSICASASKIFLGFSDGNGIIIDLSEKLEKAHTILENNDFSRLCLLISESPLIFINPDFCSAIENKYKEIFNYHPTTPEENKGYEAITSLIVSDGTIRKELLHNLYSSEAIVPFMEEIEQGNTQNACNAAHHAPLLRQLREFHEVRSRCLIELAHEIKLLEIDSEKFKEYIESIPNGCAECTHSNIPNPDILHENYQKLVSSASANNFTSIMDITDQYNVLRQTKVYRRLMNYGEALIDKTLMMIAAGKINEADIYATKLSRIKPFASTGNDFKNQIKAFDAFTAASNANNLPKIFSLASEFPALRTTDIFKLQIENYKKNVVVPATILIKKGDVSKVISLCSPYNGIDYFEEKNLSLLKKALLHKIELYAPVGEKQTLLQRYHECFGWDELYEQVCKSFDVIPNELKKLDEISPECKTLSTFLSGEKIPQPATITKDNNESNH